MTAYPTDPGWAYPVTRKLTFDTGMAAGSNGTEQRWPRTAGEEKISLPYDQLTLEQRDVLVAAFEAAAGGYAEDLALTLAGAELTGLAFDGDALEFNEQTNGRWFGTVNLIQAVRTQDTGELPASFPALSTGNPAQLPFAHRREFATLIGRTEAGRKAFSTRAASVKSWSAGGRCLSNADAQTLWDMFRRARGRWAEFAYTDPDDGTEYARCRWREDALLWTMAGPDENSILAQIVTVG